MSDLPNKGSNLNSKELKTYLGIMTAISINEGLNRIKYFGTWLNMQEGLGGLF